jgi:hypothetical protein
MFAGLGAIVIDCCSVEKEVMQKGSKKNYDFLSRGSRDRGIGGSGGMRVPPVLYQKMTSNGCYISSSRTSGREVKRAKMYLFIRSSRMI